MPLASVVFPAPRFPINSTTPGRNSPARRSPSAMVSASVEVRYSGTLLHGSGQILEQVGRDETALAEGARADLASQAVQINGGGDGLVRMLRELSQETGDHAGEHIACAASAHGRAAGGIDPNA